MKFLYRLYVISLISGILMLTQCDCGNSGGTGTLTKANLIVKIKDEVGSASDPCEARIILTIEPVNLTGSDGRNTGFTIDKTITSSAPTLENGKWWTCYYTEVVTPPGLRTGVWRIRAQLGSWSSQCEKDLAAGNNYANFTLGRQGCVSSGYP